MKECQMPGVYGVGCRTSPTVCVLMNYANDAHENPRDVKKLIEPGCVKVEQVMQKLDQRIQAENPPKA